MEQEELIELEEQIKWLAKEKGGPGCNENSEIFEFRDPETDIIAIHSPKKGYRTSLIVRDLGYIRFWGEEKLLSKIAFKNSLLYGKSKEGTHINCRGDAEIYDLQEAQKHPVAKKILKKLLVVLEETREIMIQ